MEKRNLTCISCPIGCSLVVTLKDSHVAEVTGYSCNRGLSYAKTEVTDPRRTVTSTIPVSNGDKQVVSVKTAAPIPKGKVFDCIKAIKAFTLTAPVSIGDVVYEDICGTGIDLVATGHVR